MPITVESAIKSDKAARTTAEGKKVLSAKGKIPKWIWFVAAAGIGYAIVKEVTKSSKGDIQSSHSASPGQPGTEGSHG